MLEVKNDNQCLECVLSRTTHAVFLEWLWSHICLKKINFLKTYFAPMFLTTSLKIFLWNQGVNIVETVLLQYFNITNSTHFWLMLPVFSGGIKWEHWPEMSKSKCADNDWLMYNGNMDLKWFTTINGKKY